MWHDRRLCDLLGIEHPIIQAPMAGSATPALAIAVSEAGGLGSLGSAEMPVAQVRTVAAEMRAGTDKLREQVLDVLHRWFIQGKPDATAN